MRRALKISGILGATVLLLVVALVAALFIAGNTDSGRAMIEKLTARLTSGHVQLSGLAGSFPAALQLDRLQLSDDHGVWLTADHISLKWSPMALITRHIQVDSLQVARLHIDRKPISKPNDNSTVSIPHIDIARLSVDALELGPQLVGTPVSLVVHASGHLRSLKDATAHIVAQRTGGIGDYELQLQFDPARMDATLKLREPANGPLENLLSLPGLGDLSVLATLNGPRAAEHIQLTLDAGALRARVQGSVNLNEPSANLNYTVDASAMTPSPGLAWQRIALHGQWQGTLKTPTADGQLEVEQLHIPGGTQLSALNASLTATGGMLTAHALVDGLTIPGPQPKLLQDAPITLDALMRLNESTRPLELTATHRLFALRAHAVTAGKQSAQLELRLPNLTPLAALGGQSVRGDANIKADVAYDGTATTLTADADAGIDGGKAIWADLLRGRSRLQVAAAMTGQQFSVERLQLTGRILSLSAKGSATRTPTQQLDAQLDLALSNLEALSPTLAGTLKLSGKVSGPSNALSAAVDLTSTLSVRGSPSGTVSASVHAEGFPKALRGELEAHGQLDGATVHLDVSLERQNVTAAHAVIRQADWKSAHVDGDLVSGVDFAQARGHLNLRMTQLGDLDKLLGTNLQGSVDGTLALTPVGAQSRAQFQLNAHDVTTGNIKTSAQLTGAGPVDALSLHVDVQSPAIGGEAASLTSTSLLNLTAHTLRLDSAEAKYRGQVIQLASPAKLSFAEGLSITTLEVKAQQATLEVDGRVSPTLDVRASLRQVQPELVNAFVPGLLASGTIQGEAQLQGTLGAPLGHIKLQAIGMRSANDAALGLPAADVHAEAQLMGTTAEVDVKLLAGSASQLTLNGHAPISLDGALDLKLAGKLDVGLLNPLLEARGKHVSGALTVDTTITGVAANPEIGGSVSLTQGSLRDYTQGINLSDIAAQLEGSHGTLRIVSLTAKAAPGTLSATGTVGVLQPKIPVDVKLTAKNAQPITNNIVTANLNADLHLTGTAREHLEVAGTIHINRADVGIPNSLPPNVAVLDVRRPGHAPPSRSEKPVVIDLNVTVEAPRQILVQGRGLDAELGGELRVRGTTDSPQVSGDFELQRGTFDLASNRLTFSSGSVTFNGAGLKNKIDPTLDFTAQTTVVDVTATVRITGFADSPKIELTSTPELPQDEILARLLFGESASQLTAIQVVQIGAALATLSGGGGGLNPLARIQKTLGLDRLSVGSGSGSGSSTSAPGTTNSGATIEAGRYVSSRVFVAVKESTTGTSQLAVDVDLTKHLKLQTRLGNGTATTQGTTPENDPGSSVGLAYQFEY